MIRIVFGVLVFLFERLGELSTVQGLVALVTGAGIIHDPVNAFVIIGGGIIAIGVLGIMLPNEFAWIKGIADGFRQKIAASVKATADLASLTDRVAGLESGLAAIQPILAAQTESKAQLDALATGTESAVK